MMIRTGYATILQAQTTGEPDTALQAITWQTARTTAGDLLYQALRVVELPATAVIDTSAGKMYFTTDSTTAG